MLSDVSPVLAQWDITRGCNFACSFCLSNSGARSENELGRKEARIVLDRLYEGGILFLRILGGEPFYRRDILDLMSRAVQKGMLMSFSTNASLITRSRAKRIKGIAENINYLQVSLYGTDAASYKRVTGNPKAFELVTKGIEEMKRAGLDPYLFWVLTTANVDQLEAAYELTRSLGLPALRISLELKLGRARGGCGSGFGTEPAHWRQAIERFMRLRQLVAQHSAPVVQLHARPLLGEFLYRLTDLPYFYITCKAATTMAYVDAEGYCSPCPFAPYMPDSYRSGLKAADPISLLDHEFDEIWRSELFEFYRTLARPGCNPNVMFTNCPHFKAERCDPCLFTPCTCRSTIKMIEEAMVDAGDARAAGKSCDACSACARIAGDAIGS